MAVSIQGRISLNSLNLASDRSSLTTELSKLYLLAEEEISIAQIACMDCFDVEQNGVFRGATVVVGTHFR